MSAPRTYRPEKGGMTARLDGIGQHIAQQFTERKRKVCQNAN